MFLVRHRDRGLPRCSTGTPGVKEAKALTGISSAHQLKEDSYSTELAIDSYPHPSNRSLEGLDVCRAHGVWNAGSMQSETSPVLVVIAGLRDKDDPNERDR